MSRSSHSHRKKGDKKGNRTRQNLIAFVVVLIVLAMVLLYIGYFSENENNSSQNPASNNKLYTMLENNDTLNLARIELGKDISILDVSKIFYNDSIFWPYIAVANKGINDPLRYNLLYIPKGTVLNIPAIQAILLDLDNEASMEQLVHIRDSLMTAIEEKRKPKSADF
jgi:hypothetical protein